MRKLIFRIVILAAVLGAAWSGYHLVRQMPQRQQQVPTTAVRQGDVVIRAFSRGELRAVRSVTLTAPNLFGTVQVTRLAPLGAMARSKDLIVEFDDSEVLARLEEKRLELEQVEEQIKKSEAELAIRSSQDQVELLSAKYSVRRSELEVQRNELLSAIDARKNELNLEEARRRLKQLESDIKSRLEQAKAQIAVYREQRNKAVVEMAREKTRLSQTRLLSPISGLVFIHQNRFGGGRMFGMQVPDIREGDQVQTGMPVADVLDLSELEVIAKIGELDRANLREGQTVSIQLDALADTRIRGQIKSLSGTASANIWSGDPSKKFDVIFAVDMRQLLSSVGATPDQIARLMASAAQNRNKPLEVPSFGPNMPGAKNGGARAGMAGVGAGSQSVLARLRETLDRTARQSSESGQRARRGQGGGPGTGGDIPRMARNAFGFTEKEMADAELPPPPEEDSQLEVLLRPGMLADVEITVEKISNAIYIPVQAVFEKDGRPIVYVKSGNRFDERPVRLQRRSEAAMVVSAGLKPGELVALADPTAVKKDKKSSKPEGGSSPMGGAAGGKS
ncbi:MAG: HlyD family efflux transporter periplasmic adaptor subunit [Bryobacteraceae bacterium]